MRLFLLLVILLTSHYMSWGQHVIIKEDFEFYWPVQQYDIEGDWWLSYPGNSNDDAGNSRVFMMSDESIWNFEQVSLYDSIYEEARIDITGSIMYTFYSGIHCSSDSISWIDVDVPAVINTATYPYVRLYTQHGGKLIDNLLVIGYGNETSYDCNFDANQDGVIGAPDLMQFLAAYGTAPVCD